MSIYLLECFGFEVGDYEDPTDTEEPVFEEREVAALSVSSGSASEAVGAPVFSLVMVCLWRHEIPLPYLGRPQMSATR